MAPSRVMFHTQASTPKLVFLVIPPSLGMFHTQASTPKLVFLVIYIFFFLLIPFSTATTFENTTFKFDSFSLFTHDIIYEGDAYASNHVLQLTANRGKNQTGGSCGRATYKEPIHLWDKSSGNLANFTTNFSFAINSENITLQGDGMAFFITHNGSHLPPYSDGGNLGLMTQNSSFYSTNTSFVAVEYDTFTNDWDPGYNHIGIDLNSKISVDVVRWWRHVTNEGRAETSISYNSGSKNLSVLLTDGENITALHYVIDLRNFLPEWVSIGFSAATGANFETHTISSWDFSSSLQISPNVNNVAAGGRSKTWYYWLVLGVAIASVLVNILVLVGSLMKRNRREEIYVPMSSNQESEEHSRAEKEFEKVTGLKMFSFRELDEATNNFADDAMLGRGASGSVYRGSIGDSFVAVKRIINSNFGRGMRDYESEVKAISRLSHRNLVQLNGWCCEEENLLIVYEFMPNNDLYFHLFRTEDCMLTWEIRYKIALDLATALLYMQDQRQQCVLHRDIKSSNILLDSNFNAALGDFGLARLVDHGQASLTTHVGWTPGYVAPEYSESREATKESDIYSFGIVALEIACGRRALEEVEENGKKSFIKLGEHVWEHYGRGNVLAVADPRLEGNYDEERMKRLIVVGLSCAHPDPNERPSMQLAIDRLNSKAPLPELPSEMPVRTRVAPPVNVSELSVSSYRTANDSERG